VKHRIGLYFISFVLFGFLLVATNAMAQTVAYRQTNLASNLANVASGVSPDLVNPWGMAFLADQPFFIADNKVGRVTSHDAKGSGFDPSGFTTPNAAGTGFDTPTGIVADQNSFFAGPSLVKPFILVTEQGTVFTWGPDAPGDLPSEATLVVNNGANGAVYKGLAILNSSLTAPALAVTDFHGGFIETFLPGFAPVALPGSRVAAEYLEVIATRGGNILVEAQPTQNIESSVSHSESLADRIEEAANDLAAFAEGLSEAEWSAPMSDGGSGRSVGVIVHHVASVYPIEIDLARTIAGGADIADVTWEAFAELNANHAHGQAWVTKAAALELLRRNSRNAAAAVRAFTDEELDRAVPSLIGLVETPTMIARLAIRPRGSESNGGG
jgi:hypothetical protein